MPFLNGTSFGALTGPLLCDLGNRDNLAVAVAVLVLAERGGLIWFTCPLKS